MFSRFRCFSHFDEPWADEMNEPASNQQDDIDESEYLQSELLQQSFFRARNLLNSFDQETTARRRHLDVEIADMDSRHSREATERRKSIQANTPIQLSLEQSALQEGENLVHTLESITLADEFDVSDLSLATVDAADLDRDNVIFQNLLAKARTEDSNRHEKMMKSLQEFKWQQSKIVDHCMHQYRQTSGFYKSKQRLIELDSLLSKTKAQLAEKRYVLKLQSTDATSTEDLRLKYETETEEEIRKLIGIINGQKTEIERLTKRTEVIGRDTETLCKEIGQILFDLDKEDKRKAEALGQAQGQSVQVQGVGEEAQDDIFAVFPFLTGAVEMTEEMVDQSNKLREASDAQHASEEYALRAMRLAVEEKRKEYNSMLKSEENKALERLKKYVRTLEEKKAEDTGRLDLLSKLVNNADSITASMNKPKPPSAGAVAAPVWTASGGYGTKVPTGPAKGRANSDRRSIGGRISVVNTIRDVDETEETETNPIPDVEEVIAPPKDDAERYLHLKRRYTLAAKRASTPGAGTGGRAGSRGFNDSDDDEPSILPMETQRIILPSQVDNIELINDQFEAVLGVYRHTVGPMAAVVPFTEAAIQPFYYSTSSQKKRSANSPNRKASPTREHSGQAQQQGIAESRLLLASPPLAPRQPPVTVAVTVEPPAIESAGAVPIFAPTDQADSSASAADGEVSPMAGPRPRSIVHTLRDIAKAAQPAPRAPLLTVDPLQGLPQVERSLRIAEAEEAESFQTYGLRRAVGQLLGIVAVLTHYPGTSEGDFSPSKGTGAAQAQEAQGVSVALVEPTHSLTEEEELETVDRLQAQIHRLILQVKEIYSQSHHIHHNYKTLLSEYNSSLNKYERFKQILWKEIQGLKGVSFGELDEQIASVRVQIVELRDQLAHWQAKVTQRKISNLKLVKHFQAGIQDTDGFVGSFNLPNRDKQGMLGKQFTNHRYAAYSLLPQRMAVFEDINALYENTIRDLHKALDGHTEGVEGVGLS